MKIQFDFSTFLFAIVQREWPPNQRELIRKRININVRIYGVNLDFDQKSSWLVKSVGFNQFRLVIGAGRSTCRVIIQNKCPTSYLIFIYFLSLQLKNRKTEHSN